MLVDRVFAASEQDLKVRKLGSMVFVFSSIKLSQSLLTMVSTIVLKEVERERCECAKKYYYVLRPLFK
jgi:hypothetical protein